MQVDVDAVFTFICRRGNVSLCLCLRYEHSFVTSHLVEASHVHPVGTQDKCDVETVHKMT